MKVCDLIEALAQISGLVLMQPGAGSTMGYLAEVRRMRFRRVVEPGERVTMRSALVRQFGTAALFEVAADVAGEPVVAGEIVVGGMA